MCAFNTSAGSRLGRCCFRSCAAAKLKKEPFVNLCTRAKFPQGEYQGPAEEGSGAKENVKRRRASKFVMWTLVTVLIAAPMYVARGALFSAGEQLMQRHGKPILEVSEKVVIVMINNINAVLDWIKGEHKARPATDQPSPVPATPSPKKPPPASSRASGVSRKTTPQFPIITYCLVDSQRIVGCCPAGYKVWRSQNRLVCSP
jgi:hypothetical protein